MMVNFVVFFGEVARVSFLGETDAFERKSISQSIGGTFTEATRNGGF